MSLRSKLDSRAFLFEEKFDTWLDLSKLRECNQHIHDVNFHGVVKSIYGPVTSLQVQSKHWEDFRKNNVMVTPHIVSDVLSVIFKETVQQKASVKLDRPEIKKALLASFKVLDVQFDQMLDLMSPDVKETLTTSMKGWTDKKTTLPGELAPSAGLSLASNDLLNKVKQLHRHQTAFARKNREIQFKSSMYENKPWEFCNIKWVVSQDLYGCQVGPRSYLLDRGLLLLLINKIRELEVALLYSHFCSGVGQPDNFYEVVCKFVKYLLDYSLVAVYHPSREDANKPFLLMKAVEGLGVGVMIFKEDLELGWRNTALLEEMWAGLHEERIVEEDCWEDNDLCQLFLSVPSCAISELLGLAKVCGHPDIEILNGMKKLFTRTHKEITVDNREVLKSLNVLKHDLVRNFYLKHHKWPKLELSPGLNVDVTRFILRNKDPNMPEFNDILRSVGADNVWPLIDIGKNQEFDKVECILPLLKDKSISPTRSIVERHLVRRYAKYRKDLIEADPALSQIPGSYLDIRKQKAEESRALLRYLLTDDMESEMLEYLENYNQVSSQAEAGDAMWEEVIDYLVIKLTPKEKELKSEGRMFGASPLVERNRRIVQEKNVYNFMEKYMPEQLLTCSEIDTIRKLYAFRCMQQACPGHTILQISFDFSAWNNYFRPSSIDVPAGTILDKWFDTNIYGKTMQAYRNMLVYGFDNEHCYYWLGQDGGIEGLNQGTWTYCFTGAVKAALNQLNYMYRLSVKGDDCRAAIAIKNNHILEKGLDVIKDEIGKVLQEICEKFGYSLKPSESFVSLSLIATSKQYQIRDTWLPNVIKKILKVPSFSNLIYPTVSDKVSSMFSNAHSACSQGTNTICIWITAANIAGRYLLSVLPASTVFDLVVLLLWPQILGGPGALPLQTFIVRGENDLLSVSMAMFQSVMTNYPEYSDALWNILCVPDRDDDEQNSLLLADCYALRRDHPKAPKGVLRNAIRRGLFKLTTNTTLLLLLEASTSEEAQAWVSYLMSMRPFYPKIATAIWECLPYYLVEELISKFDNSQTVFRLLALGDKRRKALNVNSTMDAMLRAEESQLQFWERVPAGEMDLDPTFYGYDYKTFLDTCPTLVTQVAREKSWRIFPIKGITYPSILSQVWFTSAPTTKMNAWMFKYEKAHFSYILPKGRFANQLSGYDSHHYTGIPNNVPWLGHTTSSKLKMPQVDVSKCSPPLQKVKRLLALMQRSKDFGPDIKNMCEKILQAYTSHDTSVYKILEPETSSGSIAHRLETNSFSCTTMPNYRPNLMQMCYRDFDTNLLLRGELKDMTVNFAARAFFDMWIFTSPLQFQEKLPSHWPEQFWTIIHDTTPREKKYVPCPHCFGDVTDEKVVFTGTPLSVKEYRHINLVGLSEVEERTITQAAKQLIETKIEDKLTKTGLPMTQDLVEIARFVSATQMASQRSSFSAVVRSLNTIKLPTGPVGEILCQTSGVPLPSDIGLNDIRCMSPKCLVDALIRELWFFLGPQFSTRRIETIRNIVESLPAYKNPITGSVEMIHRSGKLSSVCAEISKRHTGSTNSMTSAVLMHPGAASAWMMKVIGSGIIAAMIEGQRAPQLLLKVRLEATDIVIRQIEKIQDIVYKLSLNRMFKAAFSNKQLWKFKDIPVVSKIWKERLESSTDEETETTHPPEGATWEGEKPLVTLFNHKGKLVNRHFEINQDSADQWLGPKLADKDAFKSLSYTLFAPAVLTTIIKTEITAEKIDTAMNDNAPLPLIVFDKDQAPLPLIGMIEHEAWHSVSHSIPMGILERVCDWCEEFIMSEHGTPWLTVIYDVGNEAFGKMPEEQRRLTIHRLNLEDAIRIIRQNPDKTWFDVQEQYKAGFKIEKTLRRFNSTCTGCRNESHALLICERVNRIQATGEWPDDVKSKYYHKFDETVQTHSDYLTLQQQCGYQPSMNYLTRCVGNMNTSVCKFLEILHTLGMDTQCLKNERSGPENSFVCTADGAGGVTAMFLRLSPKAKGLYNSLLQTDANAYGFPPETLLSFTEEFLSTALQSHIGAPGDLTQEHTQSALINWCKTANMEPTFFTCDAEGKNIDTSETYHEIIKGFLTVVANTGHFRSVVILKTFITKSLNVFDLWMALMSSSLHVHMIKPVSSHTRSGEFFIVCTGLDLAALRDRLQTGRTSNLSVDMFTALITFLKRLQEHRRLGAPTVTYQDMLNVQELYIQMDLNPLRMSAFYAKLDLQRPQPSLPRLNMGTLINEAQRRNTSLWNTLVAGKFDTLRGKSGVKIDKSNSLMQKVLSTYFRLAGFLHSQLIPTVEISLLVMELGKQSTVEEVAPIVEAILKTHVFGVTKCKEHRHCLIFKGFNHFLYIEPYVKGLEVLIQLLGWISLIRKVIENDPDLLRTALTSQENSSADIEGLIHEQSYFLVKNDSWADEMDVVGWL